MTIQVVVVAKVKTLSWVQSVTQIHEGVQEFAMRIKFSLTQRLGPKA